MGKCIDLYRSEIMKIKNDDSEGVVLDLNKYDGEINRVGISHGRMIEPDGILTGVEQTIPMSVLGKLMRIARIARPGAIYDDSASAQTVATGGMIGF